MQFLSRWRANVIFRRWLLILGIFFYLGLTFRSPYLAALSFTLFVILGIANYWQRHSLDGVSYRRRFHYTRAFPEEQFPVNVEIENKKLLPLSWLRIQDLWPKAVSPVNEGILAPSHLKEHGYLTHILSLRWFERTQRTYELVFHKRGVYEVGPAKLESGDLFGLYTRTKDNDDIEYLTVFPSLIPLKEMELPPENPFGEQRSRRRLFEDPNRPMGIREYHPEDSFRRVHWPATARTGHLQVKVYQPTSAQVMVLCLNVSTYQRYWEGVYPELLEYLLQVAATKVTQGVQDGYRVGLISNGCLAKSDQPFRVPPGRSPKQLAYLLQALAGVTPVVIAPFERYLLREVPSVPYGATLVILTAVYSQELAETLLRLKKHERQMTLISLAEKPPEMIPGIRSIHVPFKPKQQELAEIRAGY